LQAYIKIPAEKEDKFFFSRYFLSFVAASNDFGNPKSEKVKYLPFGKCEIICFADCEILLRNVK